MLIVCVLIAPILPTMLALVVLRWYVSRKQADIEGRVSDAVRQWVEPQGDGKASRMAEVLDAAGAVVGSAAARSIMASLNADASHVARVANGLADEAQGAANPLLGLLKGGKRGKGAALMRLAEMFGPQLLRVGGNGQSPPVVAEYQGRKHRE